MTGSPAEKSTPRFFAVFQAADCESSRVDATFFQKDSRKLSGNQRRFSFSQFSRRRVVTSKLASFSVFLRQEENRAEVSQVDFQSRLDFQLVGKFGIHALR